MDTRTEALGSGATRLVWTLACLEPGPVTALPEIAYTVSVGGRERVRYVTGATLDVAGVLADGEDEPRALLGFRSLEPEAPAAPAWLRWVVWGAAAAGAALLLVVFFVVRGLRAALRRRRQAAPRPAARLAALEALDLPARARHYELARLLREGIDDETGRDRRGLTDEEWLAALDGSNVPEGARVEAGFALERCAEVKFGVGAATEWAVEETFAHAKKALATLGEDGA